MVTRLSQVVDPARILKLFEEEIKAAPALPMPMPISSREYPGKEHPNKNMNRTNPFIDNGGTVKQTGDDQQQTDGPAFNDQGGYLPVMASRRMRLRKALWDAQQMPAGMDFPQQGLVTEVNQLDPVNWQTPGLKKRNWQTQLTDMDLALKEFQRDKQPQDQIPQGISDPTTQLWDGEQI